ncbi:MAG: energy-coupling factor transporter ATPase, partial [Candidatus Caldarchaeum sp.]|nr:energy-coupling factor transporter ATPase [Candidatus Caldarchaeum sp.]
MKFAVEINNYSLTFLGQARKSLKNISLKVREGEILGIIGPSGAGKTSLLLSLNGVIPNDIPAIQEGRIVVDGVDVMEHDVAVLTKHIGVVLDTPSTQLLAATVYDDVAFGPSNLGLPRDEIVRRVEKALQMTRLKGKELRNPFHLSGGEQQSLAIAGVLAMDPPIIAFDEPLSMLDPVGKETVLTVLKNVVRERNRTIIVTESGLDLESTLEFFDRVVVMKEGEVVADGDPEEVVASGVLESVDVGEPQVTALFRNLAKRGYPVKLTTNVEDASVQLSEIVNHRNVGPLKDSFHVEDGEVVLKLENVKHVYPDGVEALKGVDLEVLRGEMVGLVGSNGSGKTTLFMHAVGVLKPTNRDGRVLVMGRDTRKLKLRDIIRHVNYVYQIPDDMLFQEKVEDEIAFGPRMLGFTAEETMKTVDEMIQTFELEEYRNSYIMHLPRNIKRLVSVASVVATRPSVLLVDEPTTGLDRRTSEKVMSVLRKLNREGMTLVIVSHNMELVGEYCRRLVVMNDGRIVADGPTRRVFSDEEVLKTANLRPPQIMRLFKAVPWLSRHP